MYGVAPFNEFPGLDLQAAPDTAGCIDLLNVDFDRRGAVRQRDGYDNFTSSAAAAAYDSLGVFRSSSQLAAGRGAGIDFLNSVGAVVASGSFGGNPKTFAQFGTPTASYLYIASPGVSIRRWDGAALTTPAGMPTTDVVAVQSPDNRLVAGGNATSDSRVQFSDAGLPETWTASNYVDVTPGDGEVIVGMVAWRELLFVFKQTKFFVFYGNSTSATGTTTFNYRPVSTGVGLAGAKSVVAAPDGVYFVADNQGIYRTTGGPPQLISGAVNPIFRGGQSTFFLGGVANAQLPGGALTWWRDRLYFGFSTTGTTNNRVLVHHLLDGWWSLYDFPAGALVPFPVTNSGDELMFANAAGGNHVMRHRAWTPYAFDDGATFTSRYRSGFYDLGKTSEKIVRETELWGTGTPQVALSKDFGALDSSAQVILGGGTDIARKRHLVSKKGTLFSFQVSSTVNPWTLHRLTHNMQGDRPPGQN